MKSTHPLKFVQRKNKFDFILKHFLCLNTEKSSDEKDKNFQPHR